MALDFPNSPSVNDIYSVGSRRWQWNGTTWQRLPSSGAQGFQGIQGAQGVQGAQGEQGATGADSSVAGPQGAQGAPGAQGPPGVQGAPGPQGAQGEQGAQGVQGAPGSTGSQGAQGADGNFGGATFDYTFSSSTSNSDPGTGRLKFSEGTFSGALTLYIDDQDDNGTDIQTFLRTIDDSTSTIKGHYRVSNRLNADDFALFTITGSITESTGYFQVPSSYISGSATSFSDTEDIIITFARTGDKGDTGAQGAQGAPGPQGAQGRQGAQGEQGTPGADSSVAGPQGEQGAPGPQGAQGRQGTPGADSSVAGPQGEQGAPGPQGAQGRQGAGGSPGGTGPQGVQGAQGRQGANGPPGPTGPQGAQGRQGAGGPPGPTGPQGAQGRQGAGGPPGPTGPQGAQGRQGAGGSPGGTGPQGVQGAQGRQGAQGTSAPLQVKQTVFTTAYSDWGITFEEVTGFNVSITPSSTTNRILIIARVSICGYTNSARMAIQLRRGSTAIHTASNANNRLGATSAGQIYGDNSLQDLTIMYVDSPGSTSQQTYKIYAKGEGASDFYINRSSSDTDVVSVFRTVSSIIAMEVAP